MLIIWQIENQFTERWSLLFKSFEVKRQNDVSPFWFLVCQVYVNSSFITLNGLDPLKCFQRWKDFYLQNSLSSPCATVKMLLQIAVCYSYGLPQHQVGFLLILYGFVYVSVSLIKPKCNVSITYKTYTLRKVMSYTYFRYAVPKIPWNRIRNSRNVYGDRQPKQPSDLVDLEMPRFAGHWECLPLTIYSLYPLTHSIDEGNRNKLSLSTILSMSLLYF